MEHKQAKKWEEKQQKLLSEILKRPDNQRCADCSTKDPTWASINLGCFLCIRCAGLHRKLGSHISKIKSVKLDTFKPEWIDHLSAEGNFLVNKKYLANKPVINENSDSDMEIFIRNKYEKQLYTDEFSSKANSVGKSYSENQVQILSDMGFKNREQAIDALIKSKGNLEGAIDILVENQANIDEKPLKRQKTLSPARKNFPTLESNDVMDFDQDFKNFSTTNNGQIAHQFKSTERSFEKEFIDHSHQPSSTSQKNPFLIQTNMDHSGVSSNFKYPIQSDDNQGSLRPFDGFGANRSQVGEHQLPTGSSFQWSSGNDAFTGNRNFPGLSNAFDNTLHQNTRADLIQPFQLDQANQTKGNSIHAHINPQTNMFSNAQSAPYGLPQLNSLQQSFTSQQKPAQNPFQNIGYQTQPDLNSHSTIHSFHAPIPSSNQPQSHFSAQGNLNIQQTAQFTGMQGSNYLFSAQKQYPVMQTGLNQSTSINYNLPRTENMTGDIFKSNSSPAESSNKKSFTKEEFLKIGKSKDNLFSDLLSLKK